MAAVWSEVKVAYHVVPALLVIVGNSVGYKVLGLPPPMKLTSVCSLFIEYIHWLYEMSPSGADTELASAQRVCVCVWEVLLHTQQCSIRNNNQCVNS